MTSIYFPGLNHLRLYAKMTIRIPEINKYIYTLPGVCCFGLLVLYMYTNYSLDVGVRIEANEEEPRHKTIMTSLVGEAGLVENHSKLQLSASTRTQVDPIALSRKETEQILRDSIEIFHASNFNKPPNELCEKRPPSVIVIGVHKSGTRELMDFMHLHPHIQIYYKNIYEMNYFNRWYNKGIGWLTQQMPCSFSNQITIMKHAGYFHMNGVNVPQRIQKFNSSIKLILIVREPIARSYSAYSFFKAMRGLNTESFDELVTNAMKNKTPQKLYFLKLSIYDESMKFWLKYFNLSQILIIEHNEFKQNPASVLIKVEKFLGLGHYIDSDIFAYNKVTGYMCISSNLTTTGMSCYASNRGRPKGQISTEIKSKLTDYFKPKNERFFRIIGKSFEW